MSREGSFEFVEGATGDLAFVASGPTLEAVFCMAAEALLAATVEEPESVESRVRCSVTLDDTDLDLLLLRFLNELIYLRDTEALVLRPLRLKLEIDGTMRLEAELAGETLDSARHVVACEVKAATAHGLRVAPTKTGWSASTTLDV